MTHVWPTVPREQSSELLQLHPELVAVRGAGHIELILPLNDGKARMRRAPSHLLSRLLAHFDTANSRHAWLAGLPESERDSARELCQRLFSEGFLVEPNTEAAGDSDPEQIDWLLQSIVLCAQELRGALLSAGEDRGKAAKDWRAWLWACQRMLESVAAHSEQARAARIHTLREQLKARCGPIKLHLGCGAHSLAGWVNIDLAHGDTRLDLRHGLPFGDDSVEAIYLGHLLEHLDYPQEALALLQEAWRTLMPGGILRVAVPDIGSFALAYVARDQAFFDEFARRWQRPAAPSLLAGFLHYAGAGGFPHVLDRHRFGYDHETLAALLSSAGFIAPRRCLPGDSAIGETALDYSWALTASSQNRPYTLIMESKKV